MPCNNKVKKNNPSGDNIYAAVTTCINRSNEFKSLISKKSMNEVKSLISKKNTEYILYMSIFVRN